MLGHAARSVGGWGRYSMGGGVETFDPAALRRLLRAQGVSVRELARRLGAVRQNVSDWAHGRHRPSPQALVAVAAALQVDPVALTTTPGGQARLYDLRVWAGLTQQGLAERIGVPRDTYRAMERGNRPCSPRLIPALAAALQRDQEAVTAALRRTLRGQPAG